MKKLVTLIVCLSMTPVFAQLDVVKTEPTVEVGKVTNLGQLVIKCERIGERYVFTYQDIKFQQLTDYKSFYLKNQESFEQLYDLIQKNWDSPPKEDIMINLDNGYLWLRFARALGTTNVSFGHAMDENANVIGFSGWLTKRRLDKLFGKR